MKKYEIAAEIKKEITSGETTRREEYRAIRKECAANLAALVSAYEQSDTPAETVKSLVEALGLSNAAEIVAAVVIAKGNFDGRISRSSREWASSIVPTSASEVEDALGVYYPDKIHPAHMEQIAKEIMYFAPEALDAPETLAPRETEKAEDQENAPAIADVSDPEEEPKTAPAVLFPHLLEEIRKEYETRKNEIAVYVECGYYPHWSEEHRTNQDKGLEQYSTPAKWAAYRAGTLSREKAVEIATRRALKEVTANEQKQIEKMETAANAPRLEWCQIDVEWVKNSYWGNNPHATATAANMTTYGKASGCGYDKESAAVAEALNKNPAIIRVLYEAAEKALEDGKSPKRFNNGNCTWRNVIGYGSGYSLLPYFEGGVGVSCFWEIIQNCGFVCRGGASSRRFASYTISR